MEQCRRRHEPAVGLEFDPDDDVVSLDRPVTVELAVKAERPGERLRPDQRGRDREQEADRGRVEHVRAEGPGAEVRPRPERQRACRAG